MRILCWAQHLSGVGHYVRMRALARGLARGHTVHLVEGGRPLPGADGADDAVVRLALPVVHRADGALVAADGASASDVLAERARLLARITDDVAPDVVLVDHYPFSKWELDGEVQAMIGTARRRDPRVRVLCSLRDIAPRTRQEDVGGDAYAERVLRLLRDGFDGILVHADPAFVRLEEHVPWTPRVPVPVYYTGFVGDDAPAPLAAITPPRAVLSCGGGTRSQAFLPAAMAAFRRARDAGVTGTMELDVFPGAFVGADERAALHAAATDAGCALHEFSGGFAAALAASALSISRAGYNTTVQLLRTGVPAVVVPDAGMSDQGPRAARLAALGLAEAVHGDPPDVDALATAIRAALARPCRPHGFRLDGVATTRALLERDPWSSATTSTSPRTSR